MSEDTFTCAMCGETYGKGRTDQEAKAESDQWFDPKDEMVVICDDCYQIVRPDRNPREYNLYLNRKNAK